ncbi:MAG: hypothetical protein RUMPE_00920 [Eubacteriales bacterium SKADARSKE-1]|nr:hypothetical protein [Eubacteriales bacterium SKADARSKE-1]
MEKATEIIEKAIAELRAEYFRQWRAKNKDKVKKHNQNYWRKKAEQRLKEENKYGK